MGPDLLVADHNLHLLDGGVGVHHVKVWHLNNNLDYKKTVEVDHLVLVGDCVILAPPGKLPVHQAQAVHVSPLPAVKMFLIDCFVQKLQKV